MIVADGDIVIVHGRFSRFGAAVNWSGAAILRIQDGVLVEHWDVIQDDATQDSSKWATRWSHRLKSIIQITMGESLLRSKLLR
jgi:predicted SnoaL-like aldol condensation-catalyzing enzyme